MKKKVFSWVLVMVWCIVIFYQSSKSAILSSEESGYITMLLNRFLASIFGADKAILKDMLIRKSAHFIEYMILAALLFNALRNHFMPRKTLILSVVLALAYSISDEIHQYFIPGRAMRIFDVGVDLLGISTGAGLLFLRSKTKKSVKSRL